MLMIWDLKIISPAPPLPFIAQNIEMSFFWKKNSVFERRICGKFMILMQMFRLVMNPQHEFFQDFSPLEGEGGKISKRKLWIAALANCTEIYRVFFTKECSISKNTIFQFFFQFFRQFGSQSKNQKILENAIFSKVTVNTLIRNRSKVAKREILQQITPLKCWLRNLIEELWTWVHCKERGRRSAANPNDN